MSGSGGFCLFSSTSLIFLLFIFFWLFLTSVFLSRLLSLYWTCMRGHIPSPTLLFPSHSSSVSTTGNRWEVKGVTCRGNGLLPLACQAVITCFHTQNSPHFRGEEKLSWQPLQVPSKCIHTCSPRSWWEPCSATSYPFVSFSIIISTQLAHKCDSHFFIKSSGLQNRYEPLWFNSCQAFLLSTDIKVSCPDGLRSADLLGFTSYLFSTSPIIFKDGHRVEIHSTLFCASYLLSAWAQVEFLYV